MHESTENKPTGERAAVPTAVSGTWRIPHANAQLPPEFPNR